MGSALQTREPWLGPCVNDAAFCMFEEYFNAGLAETFKT
jgi:H+/gluconate symporter-like permease